METAIDHVEMLESSGRGSGHLGTAFSRGHCHSRNRYALDARLARFLQQQNLPRDESDEHRSANASAAGLTNEAPAVAAAGDYYTGPGCHHKGGCHHETLRLV